MIEQLPDPGRSIELDRFGAMMYYYCCCVKKRRGVGGVHLSEKSGKGRRLR